MPPTDTKERVVRLVEAAADELDQLTIERR
jgi:hypothetical protein